MAVNPIPDNVQRVTPYLIAKNVESVMEFAESVFGANITEALKGSDGSISHGEFKIGDSLIMIGSQGGETVPSMLYVYVEDTDVTYNKALEKGAKSLMEPADQFYGDRNAGVQDKDGIQWWIASRVEDVSPEEMARRSAEWAKSK
jgi:uncharacterized glyoxalase superfamily protein PhnB